MVVSYCWSRRTSTELSRSVKDMQDIVYVLKAHHSKARSRPFWVSGDDQTTHALQQHCPKFLDEAHSRPFLQVRGLSVIGRNFRGRCGRDRARPTHGVHSARAAGR